MADLKAAIGALEEKILNKEESSSTSVASDKLHKIAMREGLGVAILAAWYHGLEFGHIWGGGFKKLDGTIEGPIEFLNPVEGVCPYLFVHIPVRKYRSNIDQLVQLGIMNKEADPAFLIYHEDGLVSMLSFPQPRKDETGKQLALTDDQVAEILDALSYGGSLLPANVNNRQIQFKDEAAKRKIRATGGPVYVVHRMPDWDRERLPSGLQTEEIRAYITGILAKKHPCHYCSAQALNPREVTIHSTHVHTFAELEDEEPPMHDELKTVRNYQLGFTFAPVGDPEQICHFLAWDFPHINNVVMNMEPHAYSFSDLIKLVQVINEGIQNFCDKQDVPVPKPIYGACNHWAGNSIYHQHYQFFRLPHIPLLEASRQLVTEYQDVGVYEVGAEWPARAFVVKAKGPGQDDRVLAVADRIAREWRLLSEGDDKSHGNGISIKVNTQNTFVAQTPDGLVAVFIPRHRSKLNASAGNLTKKNAGVLEMLGYFVIDEPSVFKKIQEDMNPEGRAELARLWLEELTPLKDSIDIFRENIKICLDDAVSAREASIEKIYGNASEDSFDELREHAAQLASEIQRDKDLSDVQRGHLYRELLTAMLDSGGITR